MKGKIGRPRSEKSQEAILCAAYDLLHEKGGAGLSIEAIAKRAKVGKPTIYRWWPTLADIVAEAALRQADTRIPVPACTSVREALHQYLTQSVNTITDGAGVHLRYLMAHAQQDAAFRERFRDNFVTRRREVLLSIIGQAKEQGHGAPRHDPELLVDLVFGCMWYRLLVGHTSLDQSFVAQLVDLIMESIPTGSACDQQAPPTERE